MTPTLIRRCVALLDVLVQARDDAHEDVAFANECDALAIAIGEYLGDANPCLCD